MSDRVTRCAAESPGGVSSSGTLPQKGARCGLEAGHRGDHTVLIPTGYPWFGSGNQTTHVKRAQSTRRSAAHK